MIFSYSKTNLNNIKYCYSTIIIDPNNYNQNSIFTFWTEFEIKNDKKKYTHKCILFNIEQNTFSKEISLKSDSNFINYLIKDNYYPQNCINFRNRDIYCDIFIDSSKSKLYKNSIVIETQNLFSSGKINLVYSKNFDKNAYYRSNSIGLGIHYSKEGGFFDVILTHYHDKVNDRTFLLSSLYRKSIHSTCVFKFNMFRKFNGIIIEKNILSQICLIF